MPIITSKKYSHVIIIGAGSKMAECIAEALHCRYQLIGISRRPFVNEQFKVTHEVDALKYDDLESALSESVPRDAKLVIVCAVGRFPIRDFLHNSTEESFHDIFSSNILTFLNALRFACSHLDNPQIITFITFGSISQPYHYPQLGLYNAAKAALRSAVKTASHELSERHIQFYHLNLSTIRDLKEAQFTCVPDEIKLLDCAVVAAQIKHLLSSPVLESYFVEIDMYVPNKDYYRCGYLDRVPNN